MTERISCRGLSFMLHQGPRFIQHCKSMTLMLLGTPLGQIMRRVDDCFSFFANGSGCENIYDSLNVVRRSTVVIAPRQPNELHYHSNTTSLRKQLTPVLTSSCRLDYAETGQARIWLVELEVWRRLQSRAFESNYDRISFLQGIPR